jgi:hypothetical protein
MNEDNPSVSQALKNARKESSANDIRDRQEQRAIFKTLSDKIERMSSTTEKLNKTVEKDPFNKETFVKSFLANKLNTDFISKTIIDKVQSFGALTKTPEKMFTPVSMDIVQQGPIIDNMTGGFVDVSKEETQKQVLSSLKNLTNAFPEIKRPFIYLSKKLFELKDITNHMSKTTDKSYTTELQIYNAITEQNESLKTLLLRQRVRELPDFSKMGLSYVDQLKMSMKDIMESVKEVMIDSYKRNTPTLIKTSLFGASKGFGIIGNLLAFVGRFAAILLPFKSLMVGGAALSMIYSMFDFTADFAKTSEALNKLFTGGFSNIGENLINMFEAMQSDLGSMFEFSDKFNELISNIGDLVTNHIMPMFRAIYFDLLVRMADNIKMLFEKYIQPGVEAFNEWWNSSGPADIDRYITNFTDIFIDGLNILFRDILPPIFDLVTQAIKAISPVLEFIGNIAKELINSATIILPAVFRGFLRLFEDIIVFIQDLLPALKQIFAPESFGDFYMGIENLIGSLVKFIFNTVDNLVTFILDLLDLDQMMGLKEGETVVEGIARFFRFIGDKIEGFFKSIRDSIVSIIDDGINFVVKYNPIDMLQKKIVELFQYISDMIPSMDDIVNIIRNGAKGLSIPDWVINKVLGEEKIKVSGVTDPNEKVRDLYDTISQNDAQGATIVYAPTTNTTNNSRRGNGGGRPSGTPRTTPEMNPSDRYILGGGGSY